MAKKVMHMSSLIPCKMEEPPWEEGEVPATWNGSDSKTQEAISVCVSADARRPDETLSEVFREKCTRHRI